MAEEFQSFTSTRKENTEQGDIIIYNLIFEMYNSSGHVSCLEINKLFSLKKPGETINLKQFLVSPEYQSKSYMITNILNVRIPDEVHELHL